ncbi:MAG: hypothetical protein JXQ75_17080 [Phycisphaerae bacterium]|nr:hypothetical protein [Phycisphaerae bacterium]
MKKGIRGLSLHAETLRNLTNPDLAQVVGGRPLNRSAERRAFFRQARGPILSDDTRCIVADVPDDPFFTGDEDVTDLYGGGQTMG